MQRFLITYSKGRASARGFTVEFESQPGKYQLEFTAVDRLDAFVQGLRHFTRLGLNASIARNADGQSFLGLSDDVIADQLKTRGLDFNAGLTTGILVERIVPAP